MTEQEQTNQGHDKKEQYRERMDRKKDFYIGKGK